MTVVAATTAELTAAADALLAGAGATKGGLPKKAKPAKATGKPDKAPKTPKVKGDKGKAEKATGKPAKGTKTKAKAEPEPDAVDHGNRGKRTTDNVVLNAKGSAPKPMSKNVEVGETATGSYRGSYTLPSGLIVSKSALLRWCGYSGWSKPRTVRLLTRLGMLATQANIGCQYSDGARVAAGETGHYGPVPTLEKGDKSHLEKLVPSKGDDDDSGE